MVQFSRTHRPESGFTEQEQEPQTEHKEADETQSLANDADDLKVSELQNSPAAEKGALKIKVVKDEEEKHYREMTIEELKALKGFQG